MPSVMDYTPGAGAEAGSASGKGNTAEASHASGGLYFRHERPGQLIAGLHTEEAAAAAADPDRYARGADPEFLEAVAERLAARLPALAAARLGQGWAGLYPVTPDGLPLLGPVPSHPGAFLAGGAGGSGIQLSPVLGELLADWVLEGEPRVVPAARRLAPDRLTPP
jgi:sarcosine oxidase subunit beta